ncbi:MAG TPA: magnesium-translocating P-type ATPase [bacterium]|nr:magnesium-translocating P-type ATPase [bacterium]
MATRRPLNPFRRADGTIQVSEQLIEAAHQGSDEVLRGLGTSPQGLSGEEAQRRLDEHGPNTAVEQPHFRYLRLFVRCLINPLVILLGVLATISFVTRDLRAGTVMCVMIALGVILKFVQEARADAAAARLKAMISITTAVLRDGQTRELPVRDLVPGDIVVLAAGDMIPADVRLLTAKDLFVIQSTLTGESMPVEKAEAVENGSITAPLELRNLCYQGTSVESGSATAVVVTTGRKTYLGSMASTIVAPQAPTSFDRGIGRFTWLMIRFMFIMVPVVFLINGFVKHDWGAAFLFALAVAVGLTPEMLPMIVTVCLSRGSIAMSRQKVIVKRLNSIQNFGAMDILCTDKTGTLTMDRVVLEQHCDVGLKEDDTVLEMAFLNSHFQTGLRNILDRAILKYTENQASLQVAQLEKVDEIPFDFARRLMSVVVRLRNGKNQLICKGAPEAVFPRCSYYELNGEVYPIAPFLIDDLKEEYERLSSDGFRVLAVAYRNMNPRAAYTKDDENNMVLKGYMAFLDPPKESTQRAIEALKQHGVTVKILTGDNDLVSRNVCHQVGIPTDNVLLGPAVEAMSDEELAGKVEAVTLFARLSPAHKQRVIRALQRKKHVVGFLGDGINDAPALRAADVGISVDTAVDIARESADVILLDKDLLVLERGVLEGRKVFANILKYVRMGASSNFGNMFSVLGASAWLPFLPMAPIQILTNNLLYDFSQLPIPADNVDPEQVTRPRPWSMSEITRFIVLIGPCSSIFDYTTFLMMYFLFHCKTLAQAPMFQTGWFVESLLTQTLIIHVIRTNKLPFIESRASNALTLTTLAVMAVGVYLPFSPIAGALGFVRLPPLYWPLLALTLVCYILLTQGVKRLLLSKKWIEAAAG